MPLLSGGGLGGLLTQLVQSAGISYNDLTATDHVIYPLAGQSNAVGQNGGDIGATFSSYGDSQAWSYDLAKSAVGSTGFLSGTGDWTPGDLLAQSLKSSINSAAAAIADKSTLYLSPVVWWQGGSDLSQQVNLDNYETQFNNLKDNVKEVTGLDFLWIIIQMHDSYTSSRKDAYRALQQSMAANDPKIYLLDIDSIADTVDGFHHAGSEYAIVEGLIRDLINANNLLIPYSEILYTPPSPSGEIFRSTFTGTAGQNITTLTPETGNGFVYLAGSDGLIDTTSPTRARRDPGTISTFHTIDPIPLNNQSTLVKRIEIDFIDERSSKPTNEFSFQTLMRLEDNNNYMSFTIWPRTSDSISWYYYEENVPTELQSASQNLVVNNVSIAIEYDKNYLRAQVNGGSSLIVANSQKIQFSDVGFRLLRDGTYIDDIRVVEQSSFTIT